MQTGSGRIKCAVTIILCALFALFAPACVKEEAGKTVAVTIADSLFFTPSVGAARVEPGSDFTVALNMLSGSEFVSCDYADYSVERTAVDCYELTLHNVTAPSRVTVTSKFVEPQTVREPKYCSITYVNGGERYERDYTLTEHIRPNTWNGQELEREGCTLLGWNTAADGSGEHIGLGSRVTVEDGGHITLYAEWVEWLPESDFLFAPLGDGTVELTGYRGSGDMPLFVVPGMAGGMPVSSIASSLTTNIPCGSLSSPTLVLPDTVTRVAGSAFVNSSFSEIYFFDNMEYIDDTAFPDNLTTFHVNAAVPPHYQDINTSTYYADDVDRLILTAGQKRMIFFAGCSFAYGVNSRMAEAALGGQYTVCNMGVNGDINGAVQMEVILNYIAEGDILVHSPEVMSAPQLMSSLYIDGRFFIMCEGNYDLLAIPDFSGINTMIGAYNHYVTIREKQEECSYSDGVTNYFNQYGDFIITTPYTEDDEVERDVSYSNNAYNFAPEMLTEEGMDRLCAYYDAARAKGATVCVSYAPTNASADTSPSVLEAGAAFDKKWRAMLAERGYSLISDYRRHIYPGRFFHDSDYHMNPMGAILHTDQLLADLEAAGVVKLSVGRQ